MKYVGIDLGTTNSAISSFDGEKIQLFKGPEQHDVTPSAIFIDRRGNKYVGSRAYNNAARNPDNAAVLFKRLMGTSTPVKLPAVNLTMTPEECSAEVLRTLFGYLPEEIRGDGDTGTVITVPAASNQMQKDSTMSAAAAAGLGRVALMQEPVAAVMSVMRQRKNKTWPPTRSSNPCCAWLRGLPRRPRSSCRRRKTPSSAFLKLSWASAIRLARRSTSTSPLIANATTR